MSNSSSTSQLSIMLTSRDVKSAIAYYRDTLGFHLETAWPSEEKPMWASVQLNGQTIMLSCEASDGQDCEGSEAELWLTNTDAFRKAAGGGVITYFPVEDVDAYHKEIGARGAKTFGEPKDQFYGIRDFPVRDYDGYIISFFQPIKLESCQSCEMPLQNARDGQMYCEHCSDESGSLHPYEAILEGTIQGYFMGMQGMERGPAEVAAKEHLAKMPAWASRNK